jgi:hypothetical protein
MSDTPNLESKVITCDACGGEYPHVSKCRTCKKKGTRRIPAMTAKKVYRMQYLLGKKLQRRSKDAIELQALSYEYELHVPPPKHIGRH